MRRLNDTLNRNAMTIIEMLIVVGIIGILTAIAVPPYLRHVRKARAAEAVAAMALIRQELKDYHINTGDYFDVTTGNIDEDLPTSVASGVPTPSTAGLQVDVGVAKYFSNAAFSVDATTPASARFINPGPVDFIITVNGNNSVACGTSDCATNKAAVTNYRLEMDNSSRVFLSTDGGTSWESY